MFVFFNFPCLVAYIMSNIYSLRYLQKNFKDPPHHLALLALKLLLPLICNIKAAPTRQDCEKPHNQFHAVNICLLQTRWHSHTWMHPARSYRLQWHHFCGINLRHKPRSSLHIVSGIHTLTHFKIRIGAKKKKRWCLTIRNRRRSLRRITWEDRTSKLHVEW